MRKSEPHPSLHWLEKLQRSPRVDEMHPLGARLVFALRLIALHRKARRDPVPELAARLGNLGVAIHALELVETLGMVWPDPIQVSRICCQCLTPDEATLGHAMKAASVRDRDAFVAQFEGLLRPHRIDALWEQAVSLVAAEYAAG